MPKLEQLISVHILKDRCIDQKRRITVEIQAHRDLFNISDLLVREHVLRSLYGWLKDANRAAVIHYIRCGKNLLKGVPKEDNSNW